MNANIIQIVGAPSGAITSHVNDLARAFVRRAGLWVSDASERELLLASASAYIARALGRGGKLPAVCQLRKGARGLWAREGRAVLAVARGEAGHGSRFLSAGLGWVLREVVFLPVAGPVGVNAARARVKEWSGRGLVGAVLSVDHRSEALGEAVSFIVAREFVRIASFRSISKGQIEAAAAALAPAAHLRGAAFRAWEAKQERFEAAGRAFMSRAEMERTMADIQAAVGLAIGSTGICPSSFEVWRGGRISSEARAGWQAAIREGQKGATRIERDVIRSRERDSMLAASVAAAAAGKVLPGDASGVSLFSWSSDSGSRAGRLWLRLVVAEGRKRLKGAYSSRKGAERAAALALWSAAGLVARGEGLNGLGAYASPCGEAGGALRTAVSRLRVRLGADWRDHARKLWGVACELERARAERAAERDGERARAARAARPALLAVIRERVRAARVRFAPVGEVSEGKAAARVNDGRLRFAGLGWARRLSWVESGAERRRVACWAHRAPVYVMAAGLGWARRVFVSGPVGMAERAERRADKLRRGRAALARRCEVRARWLRSVGWA